MQALIAWMVSVMLLVSPINKKFETEAQHRDRMEEIATDIVSITYDESERPMMLTRDPRRLATMLVFEVAKHESSFYYNIDKNMGLNPRGDHGRSYCIMQINLGKRRTPEGWSGDQLIEDRRKCIRTGYRMIKRSFGACRRYGLQRSLCAYASGRCNKAIKISSGMVNMSYHYYSRSPKVKDEDVMMKIKK